MDNTEVSTLAYEMEKAYRTTTTRSEAIDQVRDKSPKANLEVLLAMWAAIDAWVDIYG